MDWRATRAKLSLAPRTGISNIYSGGPFLDVIGRLHLTHFSSLLSIRASHFESSSPGSLRSDHERDLIGM